MFLTLDYGTPVSLVEQNFPTLCVPPEAMVPKVLINPQFSFGEMSKTATEMKEHLDDICKKELSKISKTGLILWITFAKYPFDDVTKKVGQPNAASSLQ